MKRPIYRIIKKETLNTSGILFNTYVVEKKESFLFWSIWVYKGTRFDEDDAYTYMKFLKSRDNPTKNVIYTDEDMK